jgi:GDSL-like Lipase/Acylhydrolase family
MGMNSTLYRLFGATILLVCSSTFAQKKIVVMGSSTAAGSNASTYDNAWAGRLQLHFRKNTTDGLDTTVHNIAYWGYTTYHAMPTGFVPPAGRPAPDVNYNVTRALTFNPDVVILNFPSNDIVFGYAKKEMMDNLRAMRNIITATGAKCYITTCQPRNDQAFPVRLSLRETVDSINLNFGYFAVDFWSDLVTNDGQYLLRPEVIFGGPLDYHINDLGHQLVFQRTIAKALFSNQAPLPLRLITFSAAMKNNTVVVKWDIEEQEPNTQFELQRSTDSRNFETIASMEYKDAVSKAEYFKTDFYPLAGRSFYRLKIIEPGRTFYSALASVETKLKPFHIQRLYADASDRLVVDVYAASGKTINLIIVNAAGAVMLQRKENLTLPYSKILLPVKGLEKGQYFLRIQADDGQTAVKAFIY